MELAPSARSVFPKIPGFNSLVSLGVAVAASVLALFVKDSSLLSAPSWQSLGIFVLGALLCVAFIRAKSLFTAAFQMPLIMFTVIICFYWIHIQGTFWQKILNVGVSLAQFFPTLLITFLVSLLACAVRWYLYRKPDIRYAKPPEQIALHGNTKRARAPKAEARPAANKAEARPAANTVKNAAKKRPISEAVTGIVPTIAQEKEASNAKYRTQATRNVQVSPPRNPPTYRTITNQQSDGKKAHPNGAEAPLVRRSKPTEAQTYSRKPEQASPSSRKPLSPPAAHPRGATSYQDRTAMAPRNNRPAPPPQHTRKSQDSRPSPQAESNLGAYVQLPKRTSRWAPEDNPRSNSRASKPASRPVNSPYGQPPERYRNNTNANRPGQPRQNSSPLGEEKPPSQRSGQKPYDSRRIPQGRPRPRP